MSLWTNESRSSYNAASGSAPAYLSAADAVRWEKLRACHLLYTGKHRQYFLEEGRSQFNFPEEDIGGKTTRRYITYNLLRLISHTTADLMFGAKAKLDAPTPQQSDALDALARRSLLHARFHEAAVQASWSGGAFLESTLWRGQVYVEIVSAREIYPQGSLMPDGQYERYVRYAIATGLLLETIYEPGVIRRRLRKLDDKGNPTGGDLSLELWPAFQSAIGNGQSAIAPEVRTGVALNTITYVANKVGDGLGLSDFDGLVELQDSVNAKYAQVARIHAKHADPKLAAPAAAATPDGTLPATHDVWFYNSKDEIPSYITWNAEVASAIADRTEAVLALCASAEMSPVLLGIRQGATPDAARKLRLEATKDLAKTGRKALIVEPAIARCIEIALRLEQAAPVGVSYPIDPIGVQMRDGLPVDEVDLATAIATYRGAGVMSVESGVERRIEDPDAAAAEVARLKAERAAATPSIFLGGASDGATERMEATEPEEATERRSDGATQGEEERAAA